jgi:hypothetical protein
MRTYNRATIIGRVGNEVVLRYTKSGKAVVNLRLATNERRKDGPETTTWHRVVLWERQAELAEKYLTKGCLVYVEGNLTARDWTDAQGQQYRFCPGTGPPTAKNYRRSQRPLHSDPIPSASSALEPSPWTRKSRDFSIVTHTQLVFGRGFPRDPAGVRKPGSG